MPLTPDVVAELHAIVGDKGLIENADDMAPYLEEERGLYHGECDLVVRPASTDECSKVLTLCHTHGLTVTPQGGNTGLCGGAVAEGGVILSLGRMNAVEDIDALNGTMTVQAGVILANIQDKADDAGFLFPLSLGAEGTCQIGGNLATNAGGVNVVRYGNARDLVLGVEVVLADGRIWNGLKALRKDNTGYDMKHLFVGGEGTLGIITRAVLKLFPKPQARETAIVAMETLDEVMDVFSRVRASCGDTLSAFELIPRLGMQFVDRHIDGINDPFEGEHTWYVLMELTSPRPGEHLREGMEAVLGEAFEEGLVADAVLAESQSQSDTFWRLRESLPEAQKMEGGSIKHDVSVPVSRVGDFLKVATKAVEDHLPGIRVCSFGHLGDGNIHFNLSQPEDADKADYLGRWEEFNRIVHDITMDMQGSISAEHGIGKLKVEELELYKQPVELDMMSAIKQALDPKGILNPGKVVKLS